MTIKRLKINGGRWLGDVELRGSVGTGEGVMAAPEWQMRAEFFGIVATRDGRTFVVPWHRVDGAEADPASMERGLVSPIVMEMLTEEQADAATPGVASPARRRGRTPKQSGDV